MNITAQATKHLTNEEIIDKLQSQVWNLKRNKLVFVDKNNFPVEGIIGKPIKTFIRILFLTRKIISY